LKKIQYNIQLYISYKTSIMNIQLSIKIDSKFMNPASTISMTYKPSDFQCYSYYNKKSLDNLLELGNKCHLSELLKDFIDYCKKDIVIGEKLENCSKSELFNKKISVSNLLNTLSYQTLDTLINHFITNFTKDKDFYDFSVGLTKNTSDKTENELKQNLIKVKRKINGNSNVSVIVENIDVINRTKSSYFSFKDSYSFNIDDIDDLLHKYIVKLFNESIEPFSDIFMEKVISDSFRNLRSYNENQNKIYSQLERLAYEININKECDEGIVKKFDELCNKFFINFSEYTPIPSILDTSKRQVTIAISASDEPMKKNPFKFDFNNFGSYNNNYYLKIMNLKKNDLPIPEKLNSQKILNLINRTNRYFDIYKLCNLIFSKFLEENTNFNSFEDLLCKFKECCDALIIQVCNLYHENLCESK